MIPQASDSVIEGKDIICCANDWESSDPMIQKHLMLRLSKRNRILWVNSIGTRNPRASARDFQRVLHKLRRFASGTCQVAENIFVFSPIAIPFHGSRAARYINRSWLRWNLLRICRQLKFRNPIFWSFLPTSADIAGALGEDLVIYHCTDEFSEFKGADKSAVLEMERLLMRKADLAFVTSEPLLERKRAYNPNTFLMMHGVDVQHFRKACDPQTMLPPEVVSLKHPVIGFFGLIADWIDLKLIEFLARKRPDWSFVLIGRAETDTTPLDGLGNVHLLGRKEYLTLPAYCKSFSIGILPFVINELTLAVNPLKLREYLAAGLPVVSTAMPEAARLGNLVRIGESYEHFLRQIEILIAEGRTGPDLSISQTMNSESWEARVAQVGKAIDLIKRRSSKGNAYPLPRTSLEGSWQEH